MIGNRFANLSEIASSCDRRYSATYSCLSKKTKAQQHADYGESVALSPCLPSIKSHLSAVDLAGKLKIS